MDKSFEKTYKIAIAKLKTGQNREEFTLDKTFASQFEYAPFEDCQVKVVVLIDKYPTHLEVKYDLRGALVVACDRCLEAFSYPFETQHRVIYSFEKDMEESEDDDIQYLNPNEAYFSVLDDLYDFLCLVVPLRKTHEDANLTCSSEIMQLLGLKEGEEQEEKVDPRWEKLKNLKNKS